MKRKKLFSIILALAMVFSLMPQVSLTASAQLAVEYRHYVFDSIVDSITYKTGHFETGYCLAYTVIGSNTAPEYTRSGGLGHIYGLNDGWYVIDGDVEIGVEGSPLEEYAYMGIDGDVNIILLDGSHLTVNGGIRLDHKNTNLTIYAQSDGPNMGTITTSGISSGRDTHAGSCITIEGGDITAEGDYGGAGIGGREGVTTYICGGKITATGHDGAAGIGSTVGSSDTANIFIYGGDVTAIATGDAAGIGGASGATDAGIVMILGGTVHAESYGNGAGIGSGSSEYTDLSFGTDNDSGNVIIRNANVTAISHGDGAGIGGGCENDGCDTVIIQNSTVVAGGRLNGAGIGGGLSGSVNEADGGTVTITNSTVSAYSSYFGAGIGGGYDGDGGDVTITNSKVDAKSWGYGAGIGGGYNGDGGKVTFNSGTLIAYSEYAQAVGHGERADDSGSYSFPGGYLFLDNDTGRLSKYNFNKDWNSLFRGHSMNVTLIKNKDHPITYQSFDKNGKASYPVCDNYTYVDQNTKSWNSGWYFVDGTGSLLSGVSVRGDVHLILGNKCDLSVVLGINLGENDSLTVYAEKPVPGIPAGSLSVRGMAQYAGISGDLTVHGGNITAAGGVNGAGIGSDRSLGSTHVCNFTIYGGSVNATGGADSAGIGGSKTTPGSNIMVYGGEITATGGTNCMAFGGGTGADFAGSFTLADGLTLIDRSTGKQITKNGSWINTLSAKEVSISARPENGPVNYLAYDVSSGKYTDETKEGWDYLILDDSDTEWQDAWYLAQGNLKYDTVVVKGDVSLILADDCTLEVPGGIHVGQDASLTIYAQSDDKATMGRLSATGGEYVAAIGSLNWENCGDITIHGGTIEATSARYSAAIGGGQFGNIGNITIYGGDITAKGGTGIGSGDESYGEKPGEIAIYGGKITANGGVDKRIWAGGYGAGIGSGRWSTIPVNVTIYGGEIEATGGDSAAGIGGGSRGGSGGALTIYDGTITATGGESGAGIGGGEDGDGGTITIYGGTVTATGGEFAAGVGGSEEGNGGTLTIYDGTLIATGGDYAAGIGGGKEGAGSDISAYGGTITATAGEEADRAIGAGDRNSDNGTFRVAREGYVLYDLNKERTIGDASVLDWINLLNTESVSISVIVDPSIVPVEYQYYDDDLKLTKGVLPTYRTISGDQPQLSNGWYVLTEDRTFSVPLVISGDVHLVLMDHKTLTANKGIRVESGDSLTVYAQSDGMGTMGILRATSNTEDCAGIGSGYNRSSGSIVLHGGRITARGGDYAAGIGGGNSYLDGYGTGDVTIYGGYITAAGGREAAGIGGGSCGKGIVRIYGGTLASIVGGLYGGAGIGGGEAGSCDVLIDLNNESTIQYVYGGDTVDEGGPCVSGPAIGMGLRGSDGRIEIRSSGKGITANSGEIRNETGYVNKQAIRCDAIRAESVVASPHESYALEFKTSRDQDAGTLYEEEKDIRSDLAGKTELYISQMKQVRSGTAENAYHLVRFNMDGHGSRIDAQRIEINGTATQPAEPAEEGWRFEDWYADRSFSTLFDFTAPITEETVVYAKWSRLKPERVSDMPFKDVDGDAYYAEAVYWAVMKGITEGTSETRFSPDASVTRGQVVTFLWRAAGSPVVDAAMDMVDVEPDRYYTEAVRWALANGITKGTSETTFHPNKTCNRAEIVTLLARYAGVQDADTESGFTDVESTDYFAAAVKWAKDNGVTKGTSETTFSPMNTCTRAQAVTFLWRWTVK